MTVTAILEKLERVQRSRGGWISRCPSHPDKSPSLAIREGAKGILLYCHAGCRIEDICTAINVRVSDLFFEAAASRVENVAERERRILVKENMNPLFERAWADKDVTLIRVPAAMVDSGVARALALAVENGDRVILILEGAK